MNNVDLKSILESNTDEIKLNIIKQTYVIFFWYNFLAFHSRYCPRKTPESWYNVGSKTDTNVFKEYAASGGTWWHRWSRHYTTSRKVTDL